MLARRSCNIVFIIIISSFFTYCDARRSMEHVRNDVKKENVNKQLKLGSIITERESTKSSSPLPLLENGSPSSSSSCSTSPNIPSSPFLLPSPPSTPGSAGMSPNSPEQALPRPSTVIPSSPESTNPPYANPSQPPLVPSPSGNSLVPPYHGSTLPILKPPVVFPPPTTPPPPRTSTPMVMWCVAKPSVPDPIIQEALNYACGSGADCDSIAPGGSCFEPNTVFAHTSFAFNSYWQKTKMAGGTCSFGGTAMFVTLDPSYNDCQFVYY